MTLLFLDMLRRKMAANFLPAEWNRKAHGRMKRTHLSLEERAC